ncbi:MAG TPA: DUF2339 domain-containing protein, partial [Xanthomonadaceae bacterium]|nr:DUF2339 domain-containing protein [Xanthomonadaceae bacterium]
MNWVLGLIGALFGATLASESALFGAVAGFLLVFLLVTVVGLKGRLQRSETNLGELRLRVAELAARASATAAPASMQADVPAAAPEAGPARSDGHESAPPIDPSQTTAASEQRSERGAAFAAGQSALSGAASAPSTPASQPLLRDLAEPAPAARSVHTPSPPDRLSREPSAPGWDEKIASAVKRWFTEGNVPVKVGVLVLFVGVAAALRYAVAQGYFQVPIEVRFAMIGAGGVAGLMFGWRERVRKPAFGLSLQGGALGVLLMTVFAAYRMYGLLPPMATFALVVVLVAGAALLAVLQDAIALAALGFLGGYLAPVLISTGSSNPVGLFSYYAVLNAAVFAVSWKRSWRLLNLIGFGFTFGVGTAWGAKFYRPELFATVEPFLILFFAFYVVIGLLYVIRQTNHRRPWVDGTLVFGTPLLAFPLQAALLKGESMELAFSALVVAIVYGGLVFYLRRHRDERLLTEAYGALALGFATLAVPLAFSAGTTSSVWALEGAGIAWLGIRQNRIFPWLSGLALQMLAAGAYVLSLLDFKSSVAPPLLLLNPDWLGAAMLALAGFVLSLVHERHRPRYALPILLFVWATFWLLFGAATQWDQADRSIGSWRFGMLYLSAIVALAGWLRTSIPWLRLGWLLALVGGLGLAMVMVANSEDGAPLGTSNLGAWAAYALALLWALLRTRSNPARSPALAHLFWLWTIAVAVMLQTDHLAGVQHLAEGWHFAASIAPLALLTLGLWRKPALFAWPRASLFDGYRIGWFGLAAALLALAFLAGLFAEGSAMPLAYAPLLNPLELVLLATLVLLYALCPESLHSLRRVWPYAGFALITSATLRAVHHWHGEPWSIDVFDSAVTQMALTLVW